MELPCRLLTVSGALDAQDAVWRGWFCTTGCIMDGIVNMMALLTTALEVAAALAFLHRQDIIHMVRNARGVFYT